MCVGRITETEVGVRMSIVLQRGGCIHRVYVVMLMNDSGFAKFCAWLISYSLTPYKLNLFFVSNPLPVLDFLPKPPSRKRPKTMKIFPKETPQTLNVYCDNRGPLLSFFHWMCDFML